MKKTILFLLLFYSVNFYSQCYYKGALILDVNGGLEVYNSFVKVHYLKEIKSDEQEEGKTGCSHFNLGAEYALHKNFGIGLRYKANNFFQGADSAGTKPTVKSNDILLQLNFHPVSTTAFDLVLGSEMGYTMINFYENNPEHNKIWGSGTYFSMYMNPRLYIGRFGFNMKLGLPFFNYGVLQTNNEEFNKNQTLALSANPGFTLSFGIQFRFLSEKDKSKKKAEDKPKEEPKPAQ